MKPSLIQYSERGDCIKVRLLAYTPNPTQLAIVAAGICVGSEGTEKGLIAAIKSGHESVLEHINYTFLIEDVSRAFLAQITRHRIASFSVESQRYVRYDEPIAIKTPATVRDGGDRQEIFEDVVRYTHESYCRLLQAGVPMEDARLVLPEVTCTKMIVTMNARELRHFFALRCCERAQWEIREVANEMLRLCKETADIIFDDAGAPCVRGECKEARPCGKRIDTKDGV